MDKLLWFRRKIYADRDEARRAIFDYIELFYNLSRKFMVHSVDCPAFRLNNPLRTT